MVATSTHDPIRADVERALQTMVDLTVRTPLRVMTAVPRCVLRRALRTWPLAEPARVVRSLLDLAGSRSVVAPDDAPTPGPAPARPAVAAVPDGDVTSALPIEDYESLAASHVVDRLPTLTPEELRAVRAFEVAHRGRRTVLGRIDQLLA